MTLWRLVDRAYDSTSLSEKTRITNIRLAQSIILEISKTYQYKKNAMKATVTTS